MGKNITSIMVQWTDDTGYHASQTFAQSEMDDFFRWLINEGFYDDIKISKHFSTSKEVMDRLTS